jgi:hypothetical protein
LQPLLLLIERARGGGLAIEVEEVEQEKDKRFGVSDLNPLRPLR